MAKPSVIIVVIDALRADCAPGAADSPHLRQVGLKRPELPALASLVQGSTGFSQAIACASYTSTAHASLFSGLLPPEHGVRAFSVSSLSRTVRTLAEILTGAGYAACAMIDQQPLFQPQGLLRGFQLVLGNEEEALAWWDSYQGMPRFLFLHLWDVHEPYNMPFGQAYRAGYERIIEQWQTKLSSRNIPLPEASDSFLEHSDRYQVGLMQQLWEREIGFKAGLDEYLQGLVTFDRGRLSSLVAALQRRGVLENCLTIVTADHGDGRDIPPSPLCRHGNRLTDDQIRIPLFINIPGLAQRQPIGEQVSQADITPTILDTLGLLGERSAPGSPYSGRSLLPLLHDEKLPPRAAYAEISTAVRDITDQTKDFFAGRDPLIRYRVLRYPERKYWLTGKHMDLTEEMLAAPAPHLLRSLFHDLLGRRPSDQETAQWLPQIEAIPAADIAKRRSLAQRFEKSGELRELPRYAIFDLHNDPLELKPSDARSKPALWDEFQPRLDAILELDRIAHPGEPLITNEADEEVILKRLQGLGYVD